MNANGTKLFCPNCKDITVCKSVAAVLPGLINSHVSHDSAGDTFLWLRRNRMCKVCKLVFISAEISEEKLAELLELKKQFATIVRSKAQTIKESILRLGETEPISLELAQNFIRESTWWHSHSSGRPVLAPKHANRVYSSNYGWTVDFGANKFLIEDAFKRCKFVVLQEIEKASKGKLLESNTLMSKLQQQIRRSVANHEGNRYEGLYPVLGKDMMFGTTSIDVSDGATYIVNVLRVQDILNK